MVNLLEAVFEQKTEVETAGNGEEAFHLISSQHFDAVVTDIDMPELDGISFFKKASENEPTFRDRVLFFSGRLNNAREQFITDNNLSFLMKPASIEELEEQVETIIGRRKVN